jgi:hypothetical protein
MVSPVQALAGTVAVGPHESVKVISSTTACLGRACVAPTFPVNASREEAPVGESGKGIRLIQSVGSDVLRTCSCDRAPQLDKDRILA